MADASNAIGTATSAASVVADPYNPLAWVSLAKNIGSLFGAIGGGKESSVLQGLRVRGTLDANGLSTEHTTAFDQLGHTWDADPAGNDNAYFVNLGADIFGAAKAQFQQAFGNQSTILDIKVPSSVTTVSGIADYVRQAIYQGAGVTKVADATAPSISAPTVPSTSMPPNSPGTASGGSGGGGSLGGGSTVAPAPAAAIVAGVPDVVTYAIGIAIAYYIFKRAG